MYYFIKYRITNRITGAEIKNECVSDKNPFDWLKNYDGLSNKWSLIDWKEITKDEYKKGVTSIGIG
jgi:hypothetical protein